MLTYYVYYMIVHFVYICNKHGSWPVAVISLSELF